VLDGVFNHVASDSKYFDRYSRYDAAGNLTSPSGVGANDGSGACEATGSAFRSWFYLPDIGKPGRDGDPNSGPLVICAGGQTYEAWYGYSSLPKLQANSTQVRGLIFALGLSSVGPYWTQQGANGWRFDVGGDVDPGLTNENPAAPNNYWESYRAAVRNGAVTGKTDTLMLGEESGDSSAWLLGNEWDSVMNYRYRSAVMNWLTTGCVAGSGCSGGVFEDNDSNSASSSGLSKTTSGANIVLSWNPVVTDTGAGRALATSYEIYRSTSASFTPSAANLIATVGVPNFGGSSTGKITYTDLNAAGGGYFYKIRAINAGGKFSTTSGF